MSIIGKKPIPIPSGVEVKMADREIQINGPKGTLSTPKNALLDYAIAGGVVTVSRRNDENESRAQHGLGRTLLANCIEGVTKGFSKILEVTGVGFRVAVKGNVVELPKGIEARAEGQRLTLSGIDKALVGEMAARIRRIRKPEPYKGKGIKYETEIIRRKAGKSGGKGK